MKKHDDGATRSRLYVAITRSRNPVPARVELTKCVWPFLLALGFCWSAVAPLSAQEGSSPDSPLPTEMQLMAGDKPAGSAQPNRAVAIEQEAEAHWRRAFPRTPIHWHTTAHFLIGGGQDEATLRACGEQSEKLWEQWLRLTSSHPSKDSQKSSESSDRRLVIFVVTRPYELNEFALMVEDRWLPRPLDRSFWKSEKSYAYIVAMWSREETLASTPLARAIVGATMAHRRLYPQWFERGVADSFAMRVTPESPRTVVLQTTQAKLPQLLTKPDDFQKGAAPLNVSDAAACSFVQFLQRERGHFQMLLQLDSSDAGKWTEQVEVIYQRPMEKLVDSWWQQLGQTKRRRKAG